MQCDLHVHTRYSGMCTTPWLDRVCRESYNEPEEVYATLKRRGMDLVTLTDHDSIDGAEPLHRNADFFVSEEVTCATPSGTEIHVGVYDLTARQHAGVQRRRTDLPALLHYFHEEDLFFSINRAFSSLTGRRTGADIALFAQEFPGIETRNGTVLETCNRVAEEFARRLGKAPLGGSDAHTLSALGLTYTEVKGARDKADFMDGLRRGEGLVQGQHGSAAQLARAVAEIGLLMMRERAATSVLAPLFLGIPVVVAALALRDLAFAWRWRPIAEALGSPLPAGLRRAAEAAL